MMGRIVIAAATALLAACGPQGGKDATRATGAVSTTTPARVAAAPNLGACPERAPIPDGLRERREPISVPPALAEVMRADMDNFAIATLEGATVCIDASWMEAIRNPALSPDGRFAAFEWDGYEAFGHVIVDRAGKGLAIDTGVPPVASPSGKLLAAADLGEAGFGALNAFAVWRIAPAGLREAAKQEDVPSAYDWRIEKWTSETCVELSSVPWESFSAETSGPREPFRASEGNGWRLEPGRCPTA